MEEIKSIRDFKILKILDRFKGFFERTGVDYQILRRLLQMMLIMDSRRGVSVMGNQTRTSDKEKSPFSGYIISYGMIGIFIMVMMFMESPIFYKMSMMLGMVIFMLMTTMISDFSSILLDVKDKVILTPRPINSKTINAAKTLHIIIYLGVITLAIAGPAFIVGTIKYGIIFAVVFLVQLVFISVFVIFLTSVMYYLILRFFDGEKLKDIINYFQIFLSIAMTIGYQFIGRTFNLLGTQAVFNPDWWTYLIPPVWFAGPYGIFIEGKYDTIYIVLSAASIVIPVLLFILYYTKVSPYFEKNLEKLSVVDRKKAGLIEKRGEARRKLAGVLCMGRMENIFYRFTQNMISNERQFKLKLFPSLVYGAIFPFIFLISLFTGKREFFDVISDMRQLPYYLMIYMSVALLSPLFTFIYSSDKYKGAWIYSMLPVESPGPIYKGAMKRFLSRYIVPVFLFPCIVFLIVYGFPVLPHMAAMLINLLILTLLSFMTAKKELPFSMDFMGQQQQQKTGCLMYIGFFAYCGISAGIQYFLGNIRFGLAAYIAILLIAFVILWRMAFKIKWADIFKTAG